MTHTVLGYKIAQMREAVKNTILTCEPNLKSEPSMSA
jgi:hypothetical protein